MLAQLTDARFAELVERWRAKVYGAWSEGGRQYGVDWSTLAAVKPALYRWGRRLSHEAKRRGI